MFVSFTYYVPLTFEKIPLSYIASFPYGFIMLIVITNPGYARFRTHLTLALFL